MLKKDLKEQAYDEIAEFFYTSGLSFNVVKNPAFAKMLETVGRYGCGFKPPSYNDIREKFLKRAVARTDDIRDEFKEEWKKTGCTIMFDGWTDRKRRSICNFMVNSPKDKVSKMLEDAINYVGAENVVQILNVHKVTIKKGRNITTYIYSRTMLITLLRKETSGRDLIRPGATRFAIAYLTLSCLRELETPLRAMFDSDDWRSTKFATSTEGKNVQRIVKDSQFWKNIVICLKAAGPMIEFLRLVDSDEKPAMGFIYDAIDTAKEKIRTNFKDVNKRPLHAAGYYLNPYFHWDSNFKKEDVEVKEGLYSCMIKMVPNAMERKKMHAQLIEFHKRKGMFGLEDAQSVRKTLTPAEWWESYGDHCPELRNFSIRVHTKKRNKLHQKKMNDLVYVMYNLKLKNKPKKRNVFASCSFEEVASDDEWITEEEEDVNVNELNEEVGLEHLNDNDVNVDLDDVGGSISYTNASGIRQNFSSNSDEDDADGNDDGGESEDDDGDDHGMEE
ncbi:uncharacterized protein LOC130743719 [Lotus japonicus]|uniref:uncharacterized protein LOC130743719 n=1 Tax=Lotus japonicus TaxID=34305 RepID=UPI002588CEE4|nr:uncharacterized protein LOC130743719 [Lotus japonicus]